jgi:hypothetical protein
MMKQCTKCKEWKAQSEFHNKRQAKDGLKSQCKECRNAANRAYKQSRDGQEVRRKYEQSEHGKAVVKAYRQQEDAKAKQRKRMWAYRQTEASKISKRRYSQSEKGKETVRKYNKRPEVKARQRKYWKSEAGKAAWKRHTQTIQGKSSHCRANANYRNNHPERVKAHDVVNKAIRAGKLSRPDTLQCEYPGCNKQAAHYHHDSYESKHWFDIEALCIEHHNFIHQSIS